MAQQSLSFSIARFWLAGAAVAMTAIACSQEPAPQAEVTDTETTANKAPKVVATTSVLCDLTEQIAQDTVNLTCLLEAGQDPHTYQAKPSDRQAVDEADLILYDGYDFAPSVIGLVEASSNSAPRVAVFEVAVPEPLMGAAHDHDHDHDHDATNEQHTEDEPHDHSHEDDHDHSHEGEGVAQNEAALVADPHIWHSAINNGAMVEVIADELAKLNPDQADLYDDNAAQLTELFAQLDRWITTQITTIPAGNRKLVTTHDAFRYFADAYNLEVKGALGGLSTAERPSAKTLTDLADQVKAAQVPAIFAESTTNPELINTIARDAEVKVADQPLFVEGPGADDSNAPTVQAMLMVNTCTIVNALGGTCAESEAPL